MGKGRYKSAPLPARPDPRFRVTRMAFGPGFSFFRQPPAFRRKEKSKPSARWVCNPTTVLASIGVSGHRGTHRGIRPAPAPCGSALRVARWRICRFIYMEETPSAGRAGVLRRAHLRLVVPCPSDNLTLLLLIKMKLFPGIQMIWSARPSAGPGLVYDCIIA
jgi:hypothetical protein